jgi:iron complex transport system ATP-binding protein
MPLLEVQKLSFSYGDVQVLHEIDFTVDQMGLVGIIGPNGSGKSTLLKNISGHYTPGQGGVRILDKAVSGLHIQERARIIGYVPQEIPHEFDFSGFDIVMMGRTPYLRRFQRESAQDIRIVQEAMSQTNTWHIRQRSISQLSGGERQRVYISRSLAQLPRVMLLDEPISHLDIKYQLEILKLLKKLTSRGILVLAVLHDINLASLFCDEIVLLKEGRLIAKGPVRETLNKEYIDEAFNVNIEVLYSPSTRLPYIVPVVS